MINWPDKNARHQLPKMKKVQIIWIAHNKINQGLICIQGILQKTGTSNTLQYN